MLRKNRDGLFWANANLGGNQRHRRHYIFNQSGGALNIEHKSHVTVGDNANQAVILVDNWQARNPELTAQVVYLLDGGQRGGRYRVCNHAGF